MDTGFLQDAEDDPKKIISSVDSLQPDVAERVRRLIADAKANGHNLGIGETKRSQDRQNALFAQGRTAPGPQVTWTQNSNHTPGRAADLTVNGTDPQAAAQWVQANAPKHGLGVLGAKDPLHVEAPAQDPLIAEYEAQKGGTHPDPLIAEFEAQQKSDPMAAYHAMYKSGKLKAHEAAQNAADPDIQATDALGTPAQEVAQNVGQGLTTLADGLPGGKAALAGLRMIPKALGGQGESAREAQDAVTNDVADYSRANPKSAMALKVAGGLPLASQLGGLGVVGGGMAYGGLDRALDTFRPNETLADRGRGVVGGAVTGGVVSGLLGTAGKVLSAGTTALRAKLAPSLYDNLANRTGAMQATDKVGYGRTTAEGVNAPASTIAMTMDAIKNDPDLGPLMAEIDASRTMANASPAAKIQEAYRLLSAKVGTGQARAANSDRYLPGTQQEGNNLRDMQRTLVNEATPMMPSFQEAISTHARNAGNIDALQTAADATKDRLNGRLFGGKKILRKSADAFQKGAIPDMTPEQAQAAGEGVLGRVKEMPPDLSFNPLTAFGLPRAVMQYDKAGQLLRATDAQQGNTGMQTVLDYLRNAAIAGGPHR